VGPGATEFTRMPRPLSSFRVIGERHVTTLTRPLNWA
jgi:hypothetical protein